MVVVRSWYGRGADGRDSVMVWSRCARGTVEVRSRYGRGSVAVQSWYGRGAVKVLSRYTPHSLVVRARSRFVHTCYSRLDAPRTWYMHYMIYCSQYGRGAVRYSLGTLQVRSWYGTLKVHSRLVFSRALNLVYTRTVRSSVRVAQSRLSAIPFARFRPR